MSPIKKTGNEETACAWEQETAHDEETVRLTAHPKEGAHSCCCAEASAAKAMDAAGDLRSEQACACLEVNDGREGRRETRSCCGCSRHKHRSEKEYKDLLNRLSRIEGQIRGIKGMVEKDAYCPDILIQVAAAGAALNSFSKVLLASHIRSCVAEDIREGKDGTVDELVTVLQKLMK